MNKKFIVTLLLLIIPGIIYPEKILIYNGRYIEDENINIIDDDYTTRIFDQTTYEYYENENFQRVYHGNFKCKTGENDVIHLAGPSGYLKDVEITGQYQENYKTGLWKIIATWSEDYSFEKQNIKLVTTAEYLHGKLNGNCKTIGTDLKTKKMVFSSSATFINNIMIGKFQYTDEINKIFIIINFNNNGNFDGEYIVNYTVGYDAYEYKRIYKDGEALLKLHRNKNNGDILYKYDSKTMVVEKESDNSSYGTNWEMYHALHYWTMGNIGNNITTGASPIYLIQRGIDSTGFECKYE